MKKSIIVVLLIAMLFAFTGCNKKSDTVGSKLTAAFEAKVKETTDVEAIAFAISEDKAIDFSPVVLEVEEGYLAGFTSEITGFKKGYTVAPMIGSIPFVAYVFEVEDAESFVKTLDSLKDTRWNICTEADETVSSTNGNIVFFAMVSNEE